MSSLQTATLVVVVLVAAVAVFGPPADAAPQTDVVSENLGELNQIISIDGQRCMCKVFHQCSTEDSVKDSFGDTKAGCFGGDTVCCKVTDESSTTDDPLYTTFGSSTYQQKPEEPSSTETILTTIPTLAQPTPKPTDQQCQCVLTSLCLDNDTDIDIRLKDCEKNQICCNSVKPGEVGEISSFNDFVPSCGTGMPPPEENNTDLRITSSTDETYYGQFPWMAIILRTDIDEETNIRTENVFHCGGSLVHPRFVLTAAHCIRNVDTKLLKVRLGEWNTQSNDNTRLEKKTHQDVKIFQTFVHPDHNNATMYNDVALIELSSDVILKTHINTICIPSKEGQTNYDPESCVAMGWGKNGIEKKHLYQSVLKKVDLSIVPNDICQQQLRKTRLGVYFNLHQSFICAGGQKGEDVCKGDGGGPLICAVKNSQFKQYIQVGIVSWGIGCGDREVPGVYSSVNFNSQWINQHIM